MKDIDKCGYKIAPVQMPSSQLLKEDLGGRKLINRREVAAVD